MKMATLDNRLSAQMQKPSIERGGFPDGSIGKECACNAGDTGNTGSIPELGRSPGRGHDSPSPVLDNTPVFLPRESPRTESYSPWGHKESNLA